MIEDAAASPHRDQASILDLRELQNVVQRLVVLSEGSELAVPPDAASERSALAAAPADAPPDQTLEQLERDYIRRVLQHFGGNQAQAARLLAMNRNTLRWRMKKLGI